MLPLAVQRLVHLLHRLELPERFGGGRVDLDRAARLPPAIRQPRVPVVLQVLNGVEAREASRHAPHRAWASAGRWAVAVGVGGAWAAGSRGFAARVSRESWEAATAYGTPEEEEASSSPWESLKRTRTPREPRRRFVLEAFVGTGSYPPNVEDLSRLATGLEDLSRRAVAAAPVAAARAAPTQELRGC